MSKIAFIGFGEVNTPIDIIVNKCKVAEELLIKEGLIIIEKYPNIYLTIGLHPDEVDNYKENTINYLEQFCQSDFELTLPDGSYMYSIKDYYNALNFASLSMSYAS